MESDIVERLRGAASKDYGCQCPKCEAADEIERLRAELAAMRQQRDEARRMFCEDESYNHKSGVTPREVAEDRGWDCFAQKEGGGA